MGLGLSSSSLSLAIDSYYKGPVMQAVDFSFICFYFSLNKVLKDNQVAADFRRHCEHETSL